MDTRPNRAAQWRRRKPLGTRQDDRIKAASSDIERLVNTAELAAKFMAPSPALVAIVRMLASSL
jgi:hypothetical protein